MIILGIYGTTDWLPDEKNFVHGSSASLIIDGNYVGSAEEERFTRKKYDGVFPENSIKFLLSKHNIKYEDVNIVSYSSGPCWNTYLDISTGKLKTFIKKIFPNAEVCVVDHHLAHLSNSLFTSPFDDCNILTLDSGGDHYLQKSRKGLEYEINQGSFNYAKKEPFDLKIYNTFFNNMEIGNFIAYMSLYIMTRMRKASFNLKTYSKKELESNPGKIMGLSAYGNYKNVKPKTTIFKYIKISKFHQPSILCNLYDNFYLEFETYSPEDIASWTQHIFEEVIISFLKGIPENLKSENLCISGGCGLNILLNSKILDLGLYKNVHVSTSPNDSGLSLGSALLTANEFEKKIILPKNIGCVGAEYNNEEVKKALIENQEKINFVQKDYNEIYDIISEELKNNKIVAWHQGKSEYGPRALGNRSIFANPSFDNKQLLNEKVKFREHWRPYAAIVMEEFLDDWFITKKKDSHYMLFNSIVKEDKRVLLKSVNHVDNSCRIQTVNEEINDKSYNLLKKFKEKTGVPVLLNTSFNTIPGEPIVETPFDAIKSFLYSKIDYLVINNYLITKKD